MKITVCLRNQMVFELDYSDMDDEVFHEDIHLLETMEKSAYNMVKLDNGKREVTLLIADIVAFEVVR